MFCDETPLPRLDPGRKRTKVCQLWAQAIDDRPWQGPAPPAVGYVFAESRGTGEIETQLSTFGGILQVDGYAAYKSLAKQRRKSNAAPLRLAFCLAHARRKFVEVVKTTSSTEALAVVAAIAEVYRIEERKPAKLAQKDRDARWTVKYTKAKPREDGSLPSVDLAIPAFGYKNHVSIDRGFGLIRNWMTTHAAAHDGARLEEVLDRTNTASDVWADTAYRSAKNEAMLARRGLVSRIHRKKPPGRPMPDRMRIANARKSKVRSAVEHVFAHQKGPMGLVVRTIGIARARVKIGMANLAYNIRRFVWLRTKYAVA
ncbi:hypothetical protein J2S75_003883 [Ancylobacter polymorphus]|uniref:IS5/IS1182 family transposase n=1 Tax=Ancylobacter polymorphus TaxID=223390 RepID=A0ABU0BG67_9HYPH|nr:hypothetical protein [Ancylobacter polymorphus]